MLSHMMKGEGHPDLLKSSVSSSFENSNQSSMTG